jgi:pimeloyl-ACP methyl ester carboxylesterase
VDQRGYSPEARPERVEEYSVDDLCSDILGFADSLDAREFHLVGHDWGGLLSWKVAADHPDRIRSLTVLSTPHHDALFEAIAHDDDQKRRSQYIDFFRTPGGAAELHFSSNNWQFLRRVYQGKVREDRVQENIRRMAEPGALTAMLNWYRALNMEGRIGKVSVPTLYIWGTEDMAVGADPARRTATYVSGSSYDFERLEGKSHWLIEEVPEWIAARVLQHLGVARTRSAHPSD